MNRFGGKLHRRHGRAHDCIRYVTMSEISTNIIFPLATRMDLPKGTPANCTLEVKPKERFKMRVRSSNSAGATYLNRARRIEELRRGAAIARERIPLYAGIVHHAGIEQIHALRTDPVSEIHIQMFFEVGFHAVPIFLFVPYLFTIGTNRDQPS